MKVIVLILAVTAAVFAAPSVDDKKLGIVGGNDAQRGQFPHQISLEFCILGFYCSHSCGGTIVSPTTVVTAAHCIPGSSFYTMKVVAGILKLDDNNAEKQTVDVASYSVHPGYDQSSEEVQPNDIAILFLAKALKYNSQVQPAKLPSQGFYPSGEATLSGWGSIVPDHRNPVIPNTLQTVSFPVISNIKECLNELKGGDPYANIPLDLSGGNVCTAPPKKVSACVGDSGGPLINKDSVLIGVVSWGLVPCGQTGGPNVFANVGHYIDWIVPQIKDLA